MDKKHVYWMILLLSIGFVNAELFFNDTFGRDYNETIGNDWEEFDINNSMFIIDQAIYINDNSNSANSNASINHSFNNFDNNFFFYNFTVQAHQSDGYLAVELINSSLRCIDLRMNIDGNFHYVDSVPSDIDTTYSYNTTNNNSHRLEVNTTSDTFDWYVDNTLICDDCEFRNSCTGIEYVSFGVGNTQKGNYTIDNIFVYNTTVTSYPYNININNNESGEIINCTYDFISFGGETEQNAYFKWYNDTGEISGETNSFLNYTETSVDDNITCGVQVESDNNVNSTIYNGSTTIIVDTQPPVISSYSIAPLSITLSEIGYFTVVVEDLGSGVNNCIFNYTDPINQKYSNVNTTVSDTTIQRAWSFSTLGTYIFTGVSCTDEESNTFSNISVGVTTLITLEESSGDSGGGGGGGGGGASTLFLETQSGILGELEIEPISIGIVRPVNTTFTGEILIKNTGVVDKEIRIEVVENQNKMVTFLSLDGSNEVETFTSLNIPSKTSVFSGDLFVRYKINTNGLNIDDNITSVFRITDKSTSQSQNMVFQVLVTKSFFSKLLTSSSQPIFSFDYCGDKEVFETCQDTKTFNFTWNALLLTLLIITIIGFITWVVVK